MILLISWMKFSLARFVSLQCMPTVSFICTCDNISLPLLHVLNTVILHNVLKRYLHLFQCINVSITCDLNWVHVFLCALFQAAVDSVTGFGSSWSLADGDGYLKGDYDISGEVLFGMEYKNEVLIIIVKQARGLAAADKNGFSTPWVYRHDTG